MEFHDPSVVVRQHSGSIERPGQGSKARLCLAAVPEVQPEGLVDVLGQLDGAIRLESLLYPRAVLDLDRVVRDGTRLRSFIRSHRTRCGVSGRHRALRFVK